MQSYRGCLLSTVQPVDEQGHYDASHGLRGGIQQELHFYYKSSAARARRKKRGFSLCLGAGVRSRVRQSGFSRLQRNAAPGITSFRRAAPPCLYLKSDALSPGVFPIRWDLTRRWGSLKKKKERRVIALTRRSTSGQSSDGIIASRDTIKVFAPREMVVP